MGIVIMYLRGLVYTIAAVILIGMVAGVLWLGFEYPNAFMALILLVCAPLIFGAMTEGDD